MTSPGFPPASRCLSPELQRQRGVLRRQWLHRLGGLPLAPDLQPRLLGTWHEPDHTRHLVVWQSEPDVWTDAFVLVPPAGGAGARPGPAAVVFHATSSRHILQPVGLADAPSRHLALHLVRRGFVTLSPRCFIYGPPQNEPGALPATPERGARHFTAESEQLLRRSPGWSGMGKMLWDALRAVDYLSTRPDVDPGRIVCVGHSLGAKQVLYLAAFDERIRAGVFSEGGIGLKNSNWEAPWYLGERLREFPPGCDHHELLTLIAPRPFLIAGGGEADGLHTRPLVEAARPAYAFAGAGERLLLRIHPHGHDIPQGVREEAFDWLEASLTSEREERRVPENSGPKK